MDLGVLARLITVGLFAVAGWFVSQRLRCRLRFGPGSCWFLPLFSGCLCDSGSCRCLASSSTRIGPSLHAALAYWRVSRFELSRVGRLERAGRSLEASARPSRQLSFTRQAWGQ
jgi:hypothetical protein